MSKVVTPPDIINEPDVYLLVNAELNDVEMVVNWLKVNQKNCTIHLYHDGMQDLNWLTEVALTAKTVLVNRKQTSFTCVEALFDNIKKIVWFGQDQTYNTATQYLVKNG